MTASITLGVIGHVDHGKTALVRALTGIETDRLKEEQERGLSIVLGFSWLETAAGCIDLIDVPGHESFVRAMIAGATGLDGVVLCVAANEGISRQTIEHFDIARLLGLERGVVVVTKSDLVDAAVLASLRAHLQEFAAGSFLEGAPVIACSATSGDGLDDLRQALDSLAAQTPARPVRDGFFLPLDRVFTLKGFGVVGTGTLRHGRIDTGARVEVLPAGLEASVRGLQIHGKSVESVLPGQRAAVNLRGVDRGDLDRGDVLATAGLARVTGRIDSELTLLPDSVPVRNGGIFQLLTGTTNVTVRARLLDAAVLNGGESGLVQWRLERPIGTLVGERYLLRSLTPRMTLGGGRFLDLEPERHRRFDTTVQARLRSAASGDARQIAAQRLEESALGGVDVEALAGELLLEQAELCQALAACGAVEVASGHFVDAGSLAALEADAIEHVGEFHTSEPRRIGLGLGTLATALGFDAQSAVFRYMLRSLTADGRVRLVDEIVSLPEFDPFAALSQREREALAKLESVFREGGLAPPPWREVAGNDPFRQSLLKLMLQSRRLVRLRTYDRSDAVVLHASVLDAAVDAIASAYPYPAPFAVKDVRDLLGSTRRYVVPLLEHLDAAGATERTGDLRRLRPR